MKPLRRNLMMRSKKGLDYYTLIISLVGILLLSFVIFNLFNKQLKLSSGLPIGTEQFRIIKTYSAAETALSFVDDSARLALEQAAYSSGKAGFYGEDSVDANGEARRNPCGKNKDYSYWTKDVLDSRCAPMAVNCYPDEDIMKSTITTFFTPALGSFVSAFNAQNQIRIPFNYEPFTVTKGSTDITEVVGISKEPLIISVPNIKYEVKPSFRESIPVDIITSGKEVVEGARQLARDDQGEIGRMLGDFSNAGKLEWKIDDYKNPKNSCGYSPGTMRCDCNCRRVAGDRICDTCPSTIWQTITYNDVSALFSVSEKAKLLTYNKQTNKPEFKDEEYDFGLAWFEPFSCVQTCGENEPINCRVPPRAS